MAGLLDFLQTPAGQGLLAGAASYAAGAGRGAPVNSIGRGLLGGLAGYGVATDRQNEMAQQAKRNELWDVQLNSYKTDAATKQTALERQKAQTEALPTLFSQTSPGAFAPSIDGMGPTMPQSMQTPPRFDVMRAASLGFTPEQIKAYAELPNAGRAKVARTIDRDDGRGGKEIVQVDDFGQEVGSALPAYLAPVQVSQGDRVTLVRPTAGTSLPVNMSPDAKASNAVAWANNAVSRERLAFDRAGGSEASKAPAGYRWTPEGNLQAIAGGPADIKNSAESVKKVGDAKDVLGLLDEVDALLPKATGSYVGAAADEVARTFGKATSGAEATAQLKALQGALIGKMPKMSGPQSDKDVALYREMAGQVADPTLPISTRQAASRTIRALNEKYAGIHEGASAKKSDSKAVVRTGMYGGRKVVQYSDGTTSYED